MIRERVRDSLLRSPSYRSLDPEKRTQVAHDTVNAMRYIFCGEDGTTHPQSVVLGGNSAAFAPARVLAGAPPPNPPPPAGTGIGEAARSGSETFADLVANVDFPSFVGGLIDGVFNSIVTTSIKQMEAYAEMVRNVSKSVDQYMKDNVTENNARDYLADRYPDFLEVDIAGESPALKPKEGHDENALPDFFADLGLASPVQSLDEDNVEQTLVPGARRRIAMDRQQTLATMVMMGVNRLVVTNGTIEASCMFELDTTDVRTRHDQRTADRNRTTTTTRDWGDTQDAQSKRKSGDDSSNYQRNWYSKGTYNDVATFKMHTASDRSDEQTIDLHAKLGGKVKVNFKSDYFPMEKMLDALQVNQVRERTAAGVAPPIQPASALPPVTPPPPMPTLPAIQPPAAGRA